MELKKLYTAVGRLEREAGWGAIHGGYAGNGRVDCTELADLQMG